MSNESFRLLLLKYFRNGCLNRSDKILSLTVSDLIFKKNAKTISNAFTKIENLPGDANIIVKDIENYSGKNIYALKIAEFLRSQIQNDLLGAYVHGSVATSEEISYSDFDGFIILKNEILQNADRLKLVAQTLIESEKIMFEMDPLQHHGWFVLSETDLINYPDHYFPHELLHYSKCLFGESKITIHVNKSGFKTAYMESFNRMSNGILGKLNSKKFLNNYYAFKNLLSEFMLLPSFYLQAKTGQGIFKKFSFEKVRNEMSEKYSIMDEVSLIRTNWNYTDQNNYGQHRQNKSSLVFKLFSSTKNSGSLPVQLQNKLDDRFINRMKDFVLELKSRLQNDV